MILSPLLDPRSSSALALASLLVTNLSPALASSEHGHPLHHRGQKPRLPKIDAPFSGSFAPIPYVLRDAFIGHNFLDAFEWITVDDPTEGRVNYVDQATALKNKLTIATDTTFIIKADDQKLVVNGTRGRDSVRIMSKETYTLGVTILDVAHMPQGPTTWPAFWTVTDPIGQWPVGGEIDIIEGVNDQGPNSAALHTPPGCQFKGARNMTGSLVSENCDVAINYNQGCRVNFAGTNNYGPPFNANGGGWYVMRRSSQSIAIWFWARNDPSVPEDVRFGTPFLDESRWGTPSVFYPASADCTIDGPNGNFGPHKIIINLTLCGSFAGNTFPGGVAACNAFVDSKPSAYSEAYWKVNSLKTYKPVA